MITGGNIIKKFLGIVKSIDADTLAVLALVPIAMLLTILIISVLILFTKTVWEQIL